MISDYEILEHTADLKIRAYGKSLPEMFSNIVKGMFESCNPVIEDRAMVSREIKISAKGGSASGGKSSNLESLLVDFLSEVLYLSDVNNEAYFKAEFEKLTKQELIGKIFGNKIHSLGKEIKAVTWHDLKIEKINNQWQATILFDI